MKVTANIENRDPRTLNVDATTTVGEIMGWLKMLEVTGNKITSWELCRSRISLGTPGLIPDEF